MNQVAQKPFIVQQTTISFSNPSLTSLVVSIFSTIPVSSLIHTHFIPTHQVTVPPPLPPLTLITTTNSSSSHVPIMASLYAPLTLQAPLDDMPQNYGKCIPQFDGTRPITTQQRIDKTNDITDLEEVDDDDVKMMLLAQCLVGEVRKW